MRVDHTAHGPRYRGASIYRGRANRRDMPYLRPGTVLKGFSGFTLSTIRPAVPEEEAFVRGQTGSMASTLRFLASELEAREAMVDDQEAALREALDAVRKLTDDEAVVEAIEAARSDLDPSPDRVHEREDAILQAADDALAAVDRHLGGERARAARRPLYEFLDARNEGQLRMLGRDYDGERAGEES